MTRPGSRHVVAATGPLVGTVAVAFVTLLGLAACTDSGSRSAPPSGTSGTSGTSSRSTLPTRTDEELAMAGGATTVFDHSTDAFARSAPNITVEERRAFSVGNNFFNDNWVTAPASTDGRDGLGPTFNAQSCSSCHNHDGRGQPPPPTGKTELGLLLRLSVPGPGGGPIDDPTYGGQLQDHSINGVPAEGTIRITTEELGGTYADGTPYSLVRPTYEIVDPAFGPLSPDLMISPRVAPPVFGVGLLEEIPSATIEAMADPDDRDGDGVSGRANHVVENRSGEVRLGRFGWKANVASVEAQVAGAFRGDIGITSSIAPTQECPAPQTACAAAPTGGQPELDDHKLDRVTFYNRTLAVPARRQVADPSNRRGEQVFTEIGCASCHTPEQRTSPDAAIAALRDQTIRPYTDLLVHDMGEGLADHRPDGEATGSEWRTAPLWGIGLTRTVSKHTRFLHDGRARNLEEAVLWHGGEGQGAQDRFRALPADERRALLAFLESL